MNYHLIINRIKQSDIGKRMATGAFWSLTGTALAKFIVLISGILCANILGKEEYGEFGMVRSTINLFVVFGTAGFGVTVTKFISEYRKTQKSRISGIYTTTNIFVFITGITVTLLTLFFAPEIAQGTMNAPHLTTPIRLGALLLFITTINGVQNGTLSGFEDFKSIAFNTLYGSIAESVLMLVGAYYYGVSGAILGFGCGFVVIYLCNRHSIKKNLKKHDIQIHYNGISREDLKTIYKFTLPLALSSFIVMPTFWIMRTLLVNTGGGFDELAVYEAADQWKIIILFIPTSISGIVLPILSSMSENANDKFWNVLKINMLLNGSISLIMAVIVILFSRNIMNSYGEDYNDIYPICILALSTVPSSISNIIGQSIVSRSKIWTGLSFNAIWSSLMIVTTKIFLDMNLGASALALASVTSYSLHFILQFIYIKHQISKA